MNSKEIKEWSFDNYGTKNYKISHNYDWEFKEKVLLILADITERLEKNGTTQQITSL